MGLCGDRARDTCFHFVPCLSDPARRSSLCLKVALVTLHIVYSGVLFLFNTPFIEKAKQDPWYLVLYCALVLVTLVQYFVTSGSSPGFVLDAMRVASETHGKSQTTSAPSKHYASSKDGSLVVTVEAGHSGRGLGSNATPWSKLVMTMYPSGTSLRSLTCSYCNIEQPPRAKHCHDCDKCVLQFDHHCVWLGTCIGQGNHCRFWWYICEETALCIWTVILYISCLKANISMTWWKDAVMILLVIALSVTLIFLLLLLTFHSYLIMTNQTTYELVRRRRIPYLRGIGEQVHPFSKGICRNLYNFCCVRCSIHNLESIPSAFQLEEKARPYSCLDLIKCRCCC